MQENGQLLIDVVIPLTGNSRHEDLELRYCLRGLEKYLPYLGKVFLIGFRPPWFTGDWYCDYPDAEGPEDKEKNIFEKVKLACGWGDVSERFYLVNDDHFLLTPYQEEFHYKGMLADSLARRKPTEGYAKTLLNTMGISKCGKDFGNHAPLLCRKTLFLSSVGRLDWSVPYGYCYRSAYCSLNDIPGRLFPDLKIRSPYMPQVTLRTLLAGRPYFSVDDSGFTYEVQQLLAELYPVPSRYEKSN